MYVMIITVNFTYISYTSIHAMPSSSRSAEELDTKAANDVPVQVIFNVCHQMKISIVLLS